MSQILQHLQSGHVESGPLVTSRGEYHVGIDPATGKSQSVIVLYRPSGSIMAVFNDQSILLGEFDQAVEDVVTDPNLSPEIKHALLSDDEV